MSAAATPDPAPSPAKRAAWAALAILLATWVAPLAQAAPAPAVTVLLHHPNDGVDPFGFAFGDLDGFRVRQARFADNGTFPYPTFVADGVLPILALPDPQVPYEATRRAYGEAVDARLAEQAPVALHLSSRLVGEVLEASLRVEAAAGADLAGEDLHAWFAVTEDPVRYQPPTGLTNGILDHRFTVRALQDAGRVEFGNGTALLQWAVPIKDWEADRLLVAGWVEAAGPSPRFDAGEVVQATSAPLGESVLQQAKGVLVEVLSATWCDPCLYGDLAAEDLAITLGAAQPLEVRRDGYYESAPRPWLAIGLAVACGLLVVRWARRSVS